MESTGLAGAGHRGGSWPPPTGEMFSTDVIAPFGVRVAIIEPGVVLTPTFFEGAGAPPPGTHDAAAFRDMFGIEV